MKFIGAPKSISGEQSITRRTPRRLSIAARTVCYGKWTIQPSIGSILSILSWCAWKRLPYLQDTNVDCMFLFRKINAT